MAKSKQERLSYAKDYTSQRFPGRNVEISINPKGVWFVMLDLKKSLSEEGLDLDAVLDALQKKVEAAK